jgi:hypothetical protein
MSTVLILQQGLEIAREGATSKAERQAIDAAAAVMSEEKSGLGITHAGFAMTALPHKRVDDTIWERHGHRVTLLIEAGLNAAEAVHRHPVRIGRTPDPTLSANRGYPHGQFRGGTWAVAEPLDRADEPDTGQEDAAACN